MPSSTDGMGRMDGGVWLDSVVVKGRCQFGNLIMQVSNITLEVEGTLRQEIRLYESIRFVLIAIKYKYS